MKRRIGMNEVRKITQEVIKRVLKEDRQSDIYDAYDALFDQGDIYDYGLSTSSTASQIWAMAKKWTIKANKEFGYSLDKEDVYRAMMIGVYEEQEKKHKRPKEGSKIHYRDLFGGQQVGTRASYRQKLKDIMDDEFVEDQKTWHGGIYWYGSVYSPSEVWVSLPGASNYLDDNAIYQRIY